MLGSLQVIIDGPLTARWFLKIKNGNYFELNNDNISITNNLSNTNYFKSDSDNNITISYNSNSIDNVYFMLDHNENISILYDSFTDLLYTSEYVLENIPFGLYELHFLKEEDTELCVIPKPMLIKINTTYRQIVYVKYHCISGYKYLGHNININFGETTILR